MSQSQNKWTTTDVHINAGNFLSRQICVSKEMPRATAEKLLNEKDLCGTSAGWVFEESLGEVDCAQDASKKHMVFNC